MQSSLFLSPKARVGAGWTRAALMPVGPVTRARLERMIGGYAVLAGLGAVLQLVSDARVHAFGLGLAMPGAGFLTWAGTGEPAPLMAMAMAAVCFASFGVALILWFGTGNIVLPPVLWLASAMGAAAAGPWLGGGTGHDPAIGALPLAMSFAGLIALALVRAQPMRPAELPPMRAQTQRPLAVAGPKGQIGELDIDALRLKRLLLDRALQPVDAFDGFEWRDQFQTAAVRYQLNFMSYALALVQANHMPACQAYLATAQDNLRAKQGDHRIWRYWQYENAWGRLALSSDPVPRDNIMYTGFVAAQMVLAENAGGPSGPLVLRRNGSEQARYGGAAMIDLLAAQYRDAPFGLLACEPNWIYPLCNAITATAIRGHDARHGTDHWAGIEARFREGLLGEFMTASGDLVPFRSSVTGIAPPALGGAVMQAFPSFFMNSLFPDVAAQQWDRLTATLRQKGMKRAFWPIDVGNYGFSRASSYAASAAAAVEMGDAALAAELLAALDHECPRVTHDGAAHRPRASLWAHALELAARAGKTHGLRALVHRPKLMVADPFLKAVCDRAILVARAVARHGALEAVFHPVAGAARSTITIGGLIPERFYRANGAETRSFRADAQGCAAIEIVAQRRTEVSVLPVV